MTNTTTTAATTTTNSVFFLNGPIATGTGGRFHTPTGTTIGEIADFDPQTGEITFRAFGTGEIITDTLRRN